MKVSSGRFRRSLALFFASLLILTTALTTTLSTPAFAKKPTLSEEKKKIFAKNNLIFPTDDCLDGSYTTSSSGTVGTVAETDNAARVWNYFVTANIPGVSDNAAAIAGIMGNFQAESSFDPFAVNDGSDGGSANMCTGLFQICPQSGDMWPAFKEFMSSRGFTWSGDHIDRKTLETDVNKAIQAELEFLTTKEDRFIGGDWTQSGWSSGPWHFLASVTKVTNKTPEAYADLWNVVIEGAVGGESMIEDPVALDIARTVFSSNGMYQASALRRQYARELFDRFSSAAAITTVAAATGGSVTPASGNYNAVLSAKNADKYFFDGSGDVPSAEWSDTDSSSMKRLLETYGDLAYQLGRAVNAPYIAILTQMRYEDPNSRCGANNFWGNGCPPGTGTGGASLQGKNLGEGFMQYGQTLTNGAHNQALGESDPKTYLEKIGPTWVQGDVNGPGYALIDAMKSSVDALTNYINSSEGQAIVKNFGNYTASGTVNVTSSFSWTDGWVSGIPGLTKTDSIDASLSEMPAASYSTSDKKPNKILLHYTEGTGNGINAFPVGSRYPSHFIVDLKKREGFQLLTADAPSVATVSGDGTSIQIEIVGFGYSSEPGYTSEYDLHNFSDSDWDYLAVLLNAISEHYNIPLTTPVSWTVSGVSDQSTRVQSQADFDAMTGIVGHMHSPPGDDHTDPGNIWSMVEAAIKRNPSANYSGASSYNQCTGASAVTAPQITAISGGLTESQAETIASYYKSSAVDNDSWSMPINSSGKWNCFSFSAWWIQALTSIGKLPIEEIVSWGEGARDLVHNFAAAHNLQTGTTPRPYAVFSTTQSSSVLCGGSPCGHTGIVVAVNGNDVTTIEAAYGATGYTGVEHRDISYFTNSVHPNEVFAYLDTMIDQSALNKILGANN